MLKERGETLIEFALGLLLFMTTIFGTAQFGLMVFRYNMVSDLAQEGARRASVCGPSRSAALDCDVAGFVQSRALGIGVNVSVSPAVGPGTTARVGDTVSVTVQHTFDAFTKIVPAGSMSLSATSQMIISR